MNAVELEGLARQMMLRHFDPSFGAPGPGTRAWDAAVAPMVHKLGEILACSGSKAMRAFAGEFHDEFRHSLAASLRQIALDLKRGDLTPAQHIADEVLARAYRPGPDVPMPGSFAYERVRAQITDLIARRYTGQGAFVTVIDEVMVEAVRNVLLDAHEQEKGEVLRAAQKAANKLDG